MPADWTARSRPWYQAGMGTNQIAKHLLFVIDGSKYVGPYPSLLLEVERSHKL